MISFSSHLYFVIFVFYCPTSSFKHVKTHSKPKGARTTYFSVAQFKMFHYILKKKVKLDMHYYTPYETPRAVLHSGLTCEFPLESTSFDQPRKQFFFSFLFPLLVYVLFFLGRLELFLVKDLVSWNKFSMLELKWHNREQVRRETQPSSICVCQVKC